MSNDNVIFNNGPSDNFWGEPNKPQEHIVKTVDRFGEVKETWIKGTPPMSDTTWVDGSKVIDSWPCN
ncbi:hypothetical protein ACSYAD_29860 [Acaryochloris marina NIES-2412]|uniref:hypothetical protein n=1 Tax=Acaryochloris marina TaxID=155978 RepID=UPI0040597CC2